VKRIIVNDRAAVTEGIVDHVLEWIVPAMEHVALWAKVGRLLTDAKGP
jgi:hypothetical protein